MNNHNRKCLVLNCDFTPMCIIHWKKAIVWQLKYLHNFNCSIQILEQYNDSIICPNDKLIPVPAVARTTRYFKSSRINVKLSRRNLFTRDNNSCQYCGKNLLRSQLTYDHIIPKSRFKNNKICTSWTNVVTACRKCNTKKGNKTPQEANMTLLSQPTIPKFSPKYLPWYQEVITIDTESKDIWEKYISSFI